MMNGNRGPSVIAFSNGESYGYMEPASNGRVQFEASTSAGIGQPGMENISLEQALEKNRFLDKDNNELRDFLKVNTEVMKKQYDDIAKWKEKIQENNALNKQKFEQTKQLIANLTQENAQLKSKLQMVNQHGEEGNSDRWHSEVEKRDSTITQLNKEIIELQQQIRSNLTDKSREVTETVIVETNNEDKRKHQIELTEIKVKLTETENQNAQFRDSNEQLICDLKVYSKLKEELQKEKNSLEMQNTDLTHRLQTVLNDSRVSKAEIKALKARVTELEELGDVQSSPVRGEITKEEEKKQATATGYSPQYNREEDQSMNYTSDIQSLRSQVLTLINEVTESQKRLKANSDMLEKKSRRISELEHCLLKHQEDGNKQRTEEAALIETLRISLNSNEQALNAERKEHQISKKQMVDLRQSFNQLIAENKDLSESFEKYKKQEKTRMQGMSDADKQKLLDQIGRLTAQILGAEEAVSYRDSQMKQLRSENKTLREEVENTIPVLKAQAELWKSDFDAERNARERQHAEKEQLTQEIKQLQIQNQQLLDELESLSKSRFAEMQQKHATVGQSYQQNLQQHLRVAQPNQFVQYPYPQIKYPDQENSPSPGTGDIRGPPSFGQPPTAASQHEEEPAELNCPKCNVTCPDMDTLQIHVLDCIDQDVV